MALINRFVPDVNVLLAMEPEDLAGPLLQAAADAQRETGRGHFHPQSVGPAYEGDHAQGVTLYPRNHT